MFNAIGIFSSLTIHIFKSYISSESAIKIARYSSNGLAQFLRIIPTALYVFMLINRSIDGLTYLQLEATPCEPLAIIACHLHISCIYVQFGPAVRVVTAVLRHLQSSIIKYELFTFAQWYGDTILKCVIKVRRGKLDLRWRKYIALVC